MKIDRLISIIFILLDRKKISARELAAIFEVSTRTIYRDIDTLTMAGVPIITTVGSEGGISILEDYKVQKHYFSSLDLSTLLLGLHSVSPTLTMEEESSALSKIKNLIPKELYAEVEDKMSKISIDLTTWTSNNQTSKSFKKVKKAIDTTKIINFAYYDRNGKASQRSIEPYRLVMKDTSWYVQGYCLLRKQARVFRLSRMENIVLTETFKKREITFEPLNGKKWIGDKLFIIKLCVDVSARERIVERCGEEAITQVKGNKMYVDFPFVDDDYGYSLLLSFGESCECLEPDYVREKLVDKVKKVLAVYES
ncbi:putative DNA-binding transcriptional regulator YafY [Breznakia sp. PF5-3]|uniref:helix-turn-helix transcriptional regulator n=1 Tax=unclassified Breznakia TaxID=2623764 RepID=UPI0024071A6F|nr:MULTISPECIES: YafY family protein [unclassified Breznakia]MDF9824777.1 putative DNA-binding transcriptional regulator YafY [Breznakia sp. PM6-1]MDF9835767.1 putative DNA-binding transcriptional regulator YafY [Breznakia sp. PF5-3]MDF9837853.1 putative DNA-binding transcriptional regulator YafY [Breznakia sp. PFB2-8]MDF9859776.1 putative DNA-binding transcriptional regulator YafY [Breznakia sp. PH5-24]